MAIQNLTITQSQFEVQQGILSLVQPLVGKVPEAKVKEVADAWKNFAKSAPPQVVLYSLRQCQKELGDAKKPNEMAEDLRSIAKSISSYQSNSYKCPDDYSRFLDRMDDIVCKYLQEERLRLHVFQRAELIGDFLDTSNPNLSGAYLLGDRLDNPTTKKQLRKDDEDDDVEQGDSGGRAPGSMPASTSGGIAAPVR